MLDPTSPTFWTDAEAHIRAEGSGRWLDREASRHGLPPHLALVVIVTERVYSERRARSVARRMRRKLRRVRLLRRRPRAFPNRFLRSRWMADRTGSGQEFRRGFRRRNRVCYRVAHRRPHDSGRMRLTEDIELYVNGWGRTGCRLAKRAARRIAATQDLAWLPPGTLASPFSFRPAGRNWWVERDDPDANGWYPPPTT